MARKKTNFVSFLTAVVVIALLVGAYFIVAYFTNNFTTDMRTFYLVCGIEGETENERIINDEKSYDLYVGVSYRFDVKYTLGVENGDYSVKVVPYVDSSTDFNYIENGKIRKFSNLEDLSAGFELTICDGYFTFMATQELQDVLKMVCGEEKIENVPNIFDSKKTYFALEVLSADGSESIMLGFELLSPKVTVLPGQVVF